MKMNGFSTSDHRSRNQFFFTFALPRVRSSSPADLDGRGRRRKPALTNYAQWISAPQHAASLAICLALSHECGQLRGPSERLRHLARSRGV